MCLEHIDRSTYNFPNEGIFAHCGSLLGKYPIEISFDFANSLIFFKKVKAINFYFDRNWETWNNLSNKLSMKFKTIREGCDIMENDIQTISAITFQTEDWCFKHLTDEKELRVYLENLVGEYMPYITLTFKFREYY